MFDYKLLEALATVVSEGGFDKAADKLFITQSAVSQRIKLLEEQMGQILITRMSPPLPTSPGKQLIKHYSQVKHLEEELNYSNKESDEKEYTSISIGLNADSLATWFLSAIKPYLKKEKVLIELKVDDQDQTSALLKNGEVAGCISSSNVPIQGCNMHYLGKMEYAMVCTKGFKTLWFNDGFLLKQINKAPSVIFNKKDNLHFQFLNEILTSAIDVIPIHYIPSSEKFLAIILMELAYGAVPLFQCEKLIKEKKLIELSKHRLGIDLYWHHWKINSSKMNELNQIILDGSRQFLK